MALGPSHPYGNDSPRYMGLPIRVRWEGWTSNTYELQQNGWEVSVAQVMRNDYDGRQCMQIAIRSRTMKLVGLSHPIDFNYREIWNKDQYLAGIEIPIVHIAPQIHVQIITQDRRSLDWSKFSPVDATPSVITKSIQSLEDLIHFQPVPQSQEIIIPEKSVSDLLAEILQKQEPEQMQYWKRFQEEAMLAKGRARDIEGMPEKKVHAQIITLRQRAA